MKVLGLLHSARAALIALGLATFTPLAVAGPLEDALDGAGITVSTSGDVPWSSQTSITHDTVDALQSGAAGSEQTSVLTVTVNGPGILRFRCRRMGLGTINARPQGNELFTNYTHIFGFGFHLGTEPELEPAEGVWKETKVVVGSSGPKSIIFTVGENATLWLDEMSFTAFALAPPIFVSEYYSVYSQFIAASLGQTITMSRSYISSGSTSVSWKLGAEDLGAGVISTHPNGGNSSLSVGPITSGDLGDYQATITNANGTDASRLINVSLRDYHSALESQASDFEITSEGTYGVLEPIVESGFHDGVDGLKTLIPGTFHESRLLIRPRNLAPGDIVRFWCRVVGDAPESEVYVGVWIGSFNLSIEDGAGGDSGWVQVEVTLPPEFTTDTNIYINLWSSYGPGSVWLDSLSYESTNPPGLADALDGTGFVASSLGEPWTYQTSVTHDDEDAVVSPSLSVGHEMTALQLESGNGITPGIYRFWWKMTGDGTGLVVPNELDTTILDGSKRQIQGPTDWTYVEVARHSGLPINVRFTQDDGAPAQLYVDQVTFTPLETSAPAFGELKPRVTGLPPSENSTFGDIRVLGAAPIEVTWTKDGQPFPGLIQLLSGENIYRIQPDFGALGTITAESAGVYVAQATNSVDSATSSEQVLEVWDYPTALDFQEGDFGTTISESETTVFSVVNGAAAADGIDAAQVVLQPGEKSVLRVIFPNAPGFREFYMKWRMQGAEHGGSVFARLSHSEGAIEPTNWPRFSGPPPDPMFNWFHSSEWTTWRAQLPEVTSGYYILNLVVTNDCPTEEITVSLDQFEVISIYDALEISDFSVITSLGSMPHLNANPYPSIILGEEAHDGIDAIEVQHSGEDPGLLSLETTVPVEGGILKFWMRLTGHGHVDLPLSGGTVETSSESSGDTGWVYYEIPVAPGSIAPEPDGWLLHPDHLNSVTLRLDQVSFDPASSLEDALDFTASSEFSLTGNWVIQNTVTFDGTDAVRTPQIAPMSSTSLSGSVTGPCVLRFRWKSTGDGHAELAGLDTFDYLLPTTRLQYNAPPDQWQEAVYYIRFAGAQNFTITAHQESGEDYVLYLDDFSIESVEETAPVVELVRRIYVYSAGATARLMAGAFGPAPLSSSWQRAETVVGSGVIYSIPSFPFDTVSMLEIPGVTTAEAGDYIATFTNGNGSTPSPVRTLEVLEAMRWALDYPANGHFHSIFSYNGTYHMEGEGSDHVLNDTAFGTYFGPMAHDGQDSAHVVVNPGKHAFMKIYFEPGLAGGELKFWWRRSSGVPANYSSMTVGAFVGNYSSSELSSIGLEGGLTGDSGWQQATITLPAEEIPSDGLAELTIYVHNDQLAAEDLTVWVDEVSYVPAPTLNNALDGTGYTATTSNPSGWTQQTDVTFDNDDDAAVSGDLNPGEENYLQVSAPVPGIYRFWWKLTGDGEAWISPDHPSAVSLDGSVRTLGPDSDWALVAIAMPTAGPMTIRLRQSLYGAPAKLYVDRMYFDPLSETAPTFVGLSSRFIGLPPSDFGVFGEALVFGANPIEVHWTKDGQPIPGIFQNYLGDYGYRILPDFGMYGAIRPESEGVYQASASNDFGGPTSGELNLKVWDYPEALDFTEGDFINSYSESESTIFSVITGAEAADGVDAAQVVVHPGGKSFLRVTIPYVPGHRQLALKWRIQGVENGGSVFVKLTDSEGNEHANWPLFSGPPPNPEVNFHYFSDWRTWQTQLPYTMGSGYTLTLEATNDCPSQDITVSLDQFEITSLNEALEMTDLGVVEAVGEVFDANINPNPTIVRGAAAHDGVDAASFAHHSLSATGRVDLDATLPPQGGTLSFWMRVTGHGQLDLPLGGGTVEAGTSESSVDTGWVFYQIPVAPGTVSPEPDGWFMQSTNASFGITVMLDQVAFSPPLTLQSALDGTGFEAISVGTPPWTPQTTVTHDGEDAVVSPTLSPGHDPTYLWLDSGYFVGPGIYRFWWKMTGDGTGLVEPNESNATILDGSKRRIVGPTDWTYVEVQSHGPFPISIRFTQNEGAPAQLYVDDVTFTPLGITPALFGEMNPRVIGLPPSDNNTFGEMRVLGAAPIEVTWTKDGQPFPGIMQPVYGNYRILPDFGMASGTITAESAGVYQVHASNAYGDSSAEQVLEVWDYPTALDFHAGEGEFLAPHSESETTVFGVVTGAAAFDGVDAAQVVLQPGEKSVLRMTLPIGAREISLKWRLQGAEHGGSVFARVEDNSTEYAYWPRFSGPPPPASVVSYSTEWETWSLPIGDPIDGNIVLSLEVSNDCPSQEITVTLDQFVVKTIQEALDVVSPTPITYLGYPDPAAPQIQITGPEAAHDGVDAIRVEYQGGEPGRVFRLHADGHPSGSVLRFWMKLTGHGSVTLPFNGGTISTAAETPTSAWTKYEVVFPDGNHPDSDGWGLEILSGSELVLELDQVEVSNALYGSPYADKWTYLPLFQARSEVGTKITFPYAGYAFVPPYVYGMPTITFNWTKDGVPITAPVEDPYSEGHFQITDFQGEDAGQYVYVAQNSLGSDAYPAVNVQVVTGLGQAAGYPSTPWSTYGNGDLWNVDSTESHGGGSSLRAEAGTNNAINKVSTVIQGTGLLKFWIKLDTARPGGMDQVYVRVNETTITSWEGDLDWQEVSVPLTAETNSVEWVFNRSSMFPDAPSFVYLDDVSFHPSLESALDGTGYTVTSSHPATPWTVQTTDTHDDVDAVASPPIEPGGYSYLRFDAPVAGIYRFWWKLTGDGIGRVFPDYISNPVLDGSKGRISGPTDWTYVEMTTSFEGHSVRLELTQFEGEPAQLLVDQVSFTPLSESAPQFSGMSPLIFGRASTFSSNLLTPVVVGAGGIADHTATWTRNGEPVEGDFQLLYETMSLDSMFQASLPFSYEGPPYSRGGRHLSADGYQFHRNLRFRGANPGVLGLPRRPWIRRSIWNPLSLRQKGQAPSSGW